MHFLNKLKKEKILLNKYFFIFRYTSSLNKNFGAIQEVQLVDLIEHSSHKLSQGRHSL
jgi:hypothetical protein